MPFVMSFRMLQKMSCPCLRNYPLNNLSLSETIWIFILLFLVLTYPDPFYHIFTGFRFTDTASYHCHFYYTCYFYQHAVFTGYHAVKFTFNLSAHRHICHLLCVYRAFQSFFPSIPRTSHTSASLQFFHSSRHLHTGFNISPAMILWYDLWYFLWYFPTYLFIWLISNPLKYKIPRDLISLLNNTCV